MQISRISSNTHPNFIFYITKSDEEYEYSHAGAMLIRTTHAIYRPYKNESNAHIRYVMRKFRGRHQCYEYYNNGISDIFYNVWNENTCKRGKRLDYDGKDEDTFIIDEKKSTKEKFTSETFHGHKYITK